MLNSSATGAFSNNLSDTQTSLKTQLWRYFYRARFLADVPGHLKRLKFQRLRAAYYNAFWKRAAHEINASISPTTGGFHKIRLGDLETLVRGGEVMLDSHLTLEIMGNKPLVYNLLAERGLPVPRHRTFDMCSLDVATDFLNQHNDVVVIKPANGTGGGRGVTTGVRTVAELKNASRVAARYCARIVIEEQLSGHSFRLLYVGGVLVDAVRRDPPVVYGDGVSTIRQLVKTENKRRLDGDPVTALSPLQLDRDCLFHLRQSGRTFGSRPENGSAVEVKKAINENASSQNHRVLSEVHPETVALGAKLVRDLGVTLAGLDIICRDISEPIRCGNGLITEINTTPGLHHHDLIASSDDHTNVGSGILRYMFENQNGTMRLSERENMPPSTLENDTISNGCPP